MTQNFKIKIEYDGTPWYGWQKQKDVRTVQGEIETVLSNMTKEKITIHGSGRTDAGVHALAQVANFHSSTRITPLALLKGLNCLLPETIVIRECKIVDNDFHSRFSAISKTYRYSIINQQIPLAVGRQYTWHILKRLNFEAMKEACNYMKGEQDYKSFETSGSPRAHTIRNVKKAELVQKGNGELMFETEANGFLKNMVRNMVGTLVEVGLGKNKPEDVKKILAYQDRRKAGAVAPAKGLFLIHVNYNH